MLKGFKQSRWPTTKQKITLIAGRRPCAVAHVLSGFFGARCLGRARTLVAPTSQASLRVAAPSQALKNALRSVFHRAISHPRHRFACPGANAAKTLRRPRRSIDNRNRPGPGAKTRPGMGGRCFSAVGGGFFWPKAPGTRSCARGAEAAGQ